MTSPEINLLYELVNMSMLVKLQSMKIAGAQPHEDNMHVFQ